MTYLLNRSALVNRTIWLAFLAICIPSTLGTRSSLGQGASQDQAQERSGSRRANENDHYCLRISSQQQPEDAVAIYARVNGESIEQLERAAMESLFTYFDYNHDGLLTDIETRNLPAPSVFARYLFSPLNPSLAAETVALAERVTSEQLYGWYKAQGVSFLHIGWGVDTSWAALDLSMREFINDLKLVEQSEDNNAWRQHALRGFHALDDNLDGILTAAEIHPALCYPSTTASNRLQHRELTVSAGSVQLRQQLNTDEWLYPSQREVADLPFAVRYTLSLYGSDRPEHTSANRESAGQQNIATIAAADILVRLDNGSLESELLDISKKIGHLMAESDLDSNSILETAELHEKSARLLRHLLPQADINQDDKLSKQEVEQWCELWKTIARSQIVITVVGQRRGIWERADRNYDGRLSQVEWLEFLTSQSLTGNGEPAWKMPVGGQLRITGSIGRPTSLLNTPTLDGPEWFRATDVNHDQFLQREEFVGPLHIFETLDRNQDGFLSSAEAAVAAER